MGTPLATNTQKLFGTDVIQTHNLISVGFICSISAISCRRINARKVVNPTYNLFSVPLFSVALFCAEATVAFAAISTAAKATAAMFPFALAKENR